MGFLDFLKKDAPAPSQAAPSWNSDMPPLPPSPVTPAPLPPTAVPPPVYAPLSAPPVTPEPSWAADPVPPPPASQANPWTADALPPVPLPPAAPIPAAPALPSSLDMWAAPQPMQEASAQTSLAQPAPAVPAAPMPAAPATPPPAHIELPDFTDEDIAEIEQLEHPAASLPALPEITVAPPKVKLVSEEPVVPAPANAVALPPDEILLPLGEEVKVERLEAAKFVSSQSYLMILGETRNIRKSLRQGDELIKDATLRHEQLDLQYKRAAADINSIQEHFIKIDSALFED